VPNEPPIPATLFINHDHCERLVDPRRDSKKADASGESKETDVVSASKATESDNAEAPDET